MATSVLYCYIYNAYCFLFTVQHKGCVMSQIGEAHCSPKMALTAIDLIDRGGKPNNRMYSVHIYYFLPNYIYT